jgi:VWFA-related protein
MRPILATFLAWLLVASAQQAAAPQRTAQQIPATPSSGPLKISVTTQLVVESVAVKDKNGKPVEGLTKDDFTVLEDSKPQMISFFQYQRLEENAAPEELKLRPTVAATPNTAANAVKAVVQPQIAPARPGEIKYKDRRLMVMFFDMTSMPIQDQLRAQTAALKFLKSQMTTSDLMAVMALTSDLKVLEDFTDDRDELAKTIKGLVIGEGSDMAVDGSTGADNEADTGDAYTADDTEFNIFNTDRKLAALESAAKMLGSLNEKKALVYFASGVTKTGVENEAQLRATINAAIRANVSFYPIDARGLVAQAPLGDATKRSPGGQSMYSGSGARTQQSSFFSQQETLYTLAADTGGKALLDNNDLALGIQQAQKDVSSYYILGYYPTNTALDGHFRRVKITISNAALTAKLAPLDYRQGYFANKEFKQFTSSDKERQLAEALMLGDPMTDISIALEVDYFRLARDRYFVPVVVKIPGSDLALARHGGSESTVLDFIVQIKDTKGEIKGNVRDSVPLKFKGETAAQLARHPVVYDTGFSLAPGSYSIKFLARDNETGKMGTFEQKFVVPDLSTNQKTLPLSSVVLSNQREKLDAAVFTAERDKKLLASNPLVQDGIKLVPSVTRVFRRDQEMYVYLEAYQPNAETTQPMVATVSFYRGKTKAFETAPLEVTDGLNAKSKALPVKFSVPLSKLQPGRYTCQVSVLDPAAQKFTFWRTPMVVLQ